LFITTCIEKQCTRPLIKNHNPNPYKLLEQFEIQSQSKLIQKTHRDMNKNKFMFVQENSGYIAEEQRYY